MKTEARAARSAHVVDQKALARQDAAVQQAYLREID